MMRTVIVGGMLALTLVAFVPGVAADCGEGFIFVGTCHDPNDDSYHDVVCVINKCTETTETYCDNPPCESSNQEFCILGKIWFTYGADGESPKAGLNCD